MLKVRQLAFSLEHGALYELIPKDHLLKKIAAVVGFSFANEKFADSYCRFYGRPAKEPELMFKLLFLQYLYDLSDEQVMAETQHLPRGEAGEVLIGHLETVVNQVKSNVPTVKGPLADCIRKAERLLAADKRLQTNGPSSEEDLDARVGRKSKEHLFFGYKSHVSMVEADEIITACHVTPGNAVDGQQLPILVEQTD